MTERHRQGRRDNFRNKWKSRFEYYATHFNDDAGIAGWSRTGLEARLRKFKRVLNENGEPKAGLWLDAGCGAGTYSEYLSSRGMDVLGMDYSVPSLYRARERYGKDVQWFSGDVTRVPLTSGSVKGVTCFGVMQALPESDEAIGELARVVDKDGEILVDGLNFWCLPHLLGALKRKIRGAPMHLRYEKPSQVSRLLVMNGVVNIKRHWLPILPARFQKYQWILEAPIMVKLFRVIPPIGALLSHSFIIYGKKAKY